METETIKPLRTTLDRNLRPTFVFRELCEPYEVVALMRLRHRIYFELCGYGPTRAHGVDVTFHDHRSRLYGVFSGKELVGGARTVYRTEQPLAPMIRAVRAALQDETVEAQTPALPSELAFDVASAVGARIADVEVELGRFTLLPGAPPWVSAQVVLGLLAVMLLEQRRLYLYSCAVSIAPRYARYTAPRWLLTEARTEGAGVDGYPFPAPSIAAVADPTESPYLVSIRRSADELERTGQIDLTRSFRSRVSTHHA